MEDSCQNTKRMMLCFLRNSAHALKLAFGETIIIIIAFIWSIDFTYRRISQTPSLTRRLCAFITWKYASKVPAQFFKDSFDSKNVLSRGTKIALIDFLQMSAG